MPVRSVILLNAAGDNTIEWDAEHDAYFEDLIARKMREGVTFYIIARKKDGTPSKARPKKLASAADALTHRAVSVADADWAKVVLDGKARLSRSAPAEIATTRRAKDAREAARADTVAVQPRRGG